jgi:Fe-S oxidoreductase
MDNKKQDVADCNLCGICNIACPIHFVLQKESAGSRFKVFLAKKKSLNEIFFICTECSTCLQGCPAKVDLKCLDIRRQLVESGVELPANKAMKSNIKEFGNPFGEMKKGKKVKQYYT